MEGKAIAGWSPRAERALDTLIDTIHPGQGGDGDVLAADPVAFDSGIDLATRRRQPDGALEREALERFERTTG